MGDGAIHYKLYLLKLTMAVDNVVFRIIKGALCKMLVVTQLNLINLKNNFLYEIGLIAIREVSQPFDEEQQYWRPYQPKHSPSSSSENVILT